MSAPVDEEPVDILAPARTARGLFDRIAAATDAKTERIAAVADAKTERIARPQDLAGAEARAATAAEAWRPYEFDPEIKIVNGLVYRVSLGTGGFDESYYKDLVKGGMPEGEARKEATEEPGKESFVLDRTATAAYKALGVAGSDLSLLKKSAGSVRSWADTESDKTAEATRKFKDFLARAKAASDIEQADIGTQAAKQDFNLNRAKGIESGQFSPFASFYGDVPTQLDGLSSIIRKTIPDSIPPDYGLDHVVGLPAYARGTLSGGHMPDESGLKNFIGGA